MVCCFPIISKKNLEQEKNAKTLNNFISLQHKNAAREKFPQFFSVILWIVWKKMQVFLELLLDCEALDSLAVFVLK